MSKFMLSAGLLLASLTGLAKAMPPHHATPLAAAAKLTEFIPGPLDPGLPDPGEPFPGPNLPVPPFPGDPGPNLPVPPFPGDPGPTDPGGPSPLVVGNATNPVASAAKLTEEGVDPGAVPVMFSGETQEEVVAAADEYIAEHGGTMGEPSEINLLGVAQRSVAVYGSN